MKELYFRGDSACHEARLVNWLRDEKREEGPPGFIGFAISARMSGLCGRRLRRCRRKSGSPTESIRAKAASARRCRSSPARRSEKKDLQPLRYIAIRIRKKQGELFEDGTAGEAFRGIQSIGGS